MRHFISLFLLAGVLFTLPACQPIKKETDRVHLTFSTWGSSDEIKLTQALIEEFEAQHPTIDVEILHVPENYYQKLHILIAAGEMPDVVFTNSLQLPMYAQHGLFRDLMPYLANSSILKKEDFFPAALTALAWTNNAKGVEGDANVSIVANGMSSIPQTALPRDISNLVIFYNKDVFEKYHVPLPHPQWNWEEFLAAAQTIRRNSHQQIYGVSFYTQPPLFWLPFVWSAGGRLFDADLDRPLLSEPNALKGLQFYSDLRNRYHVAPRQIESGGTLMSQLFLEQRIAMLVSGRWSVPMLRRLAKFDWDVAPFPAGEAGSRVGIDASGYGISSQSQHPQEAWILIEHLLSRQAIEEVTCSGLIIPARRDVARSDAFLSPQALPKNSRVFIDAIETGVPTHTPPRWNEISETLVLELEPVWDGKKPLHETVNELQPELNQLLGTQ